MIETKRLILRPFTKTPADLHALFAILSDVEVNTFLPWFPLKNMDEAQTYYEKEILPLNEKSESFYLAICQKNDDRPIGYLTLSASASHDLGYGLAKKFWGQDITTEAAEAVLPTIKKMGLAFITATHDINNPGSGHVMQKIGMTYKYSYEEIWQPKNFPVVFRLYQLNFLPDTPAFIEYWEKSANHFVEKI